MIWRDMDVGFYKKYKSSILTVLFCVLIVLIIYYVNRAYILNGGKMQIISDLHHNKVARAVVILLMAFCFILNVIRDRKR